MASFAPAFPGRSDRKLSKHELLNVIQLDIAAELEAIYLYESHAEATDDPIVKSVLFSISNEEKVHAGELLMLLNYLDPEFVKHIEDGMSEAKKLMTEMNYLAHTIETSNNKEYIGNMDLLRIKPQNPQGF